MIIAIDPGSNGGYAVQFDENGKVIAEKLPETDGDFILGMRELMYACNREGKPGSAVTCVIEGQTFCAGGRCSAPAIGKFGDSCGFVRGVCQALGFVILRPKPQEWQKPFGLGGRKSCDSKTAWKQKLRGEAERRFPGIKVTLATADALLMLAWYLETKGAK
jgi:hypothetical protein